MLGDSFSLETFCPVCPIGGYDAAEKSFTKYYLSRHQTVYTTYVSASAVSPQHSDFHLLMGIAAKKTGIEVHAIVVLSNHYHIILTDPYARLPEFMDHLHKLVAKCVNASLGRWENLWSSEKPSAVVLENDNDVLEKLVYTACNPVAAGLVAKATQWPGLIAFLPGQTLKANRPDVWTTHRFEKPWTTPLPKGSSS